MVVPIAAIGVAGAYVSFETPKKLYAPSNKEIIIEDGLGVINNTEELTDTLEEFLDTTGIVPAVITVSNDTWKNDYPTLERYAYDAYVSRFKDERHWLIVYSSSTAEDGFDDWYWEGMQGNDTDNILTEEKVGKFNSALHDMLLQRKKYSVGEAIENAFDSLNSTVMSKNWNKPVFFASTGVSGFFVLMIIWSAVKSLKPVTTSYYHKAYLCDPIFVDQEKCEYCGGVYVVGLHQTCPHCAAPVPAKE